MDDFDRSYSPSVRLRNGQKELNFSIEDMLVSCSVHGKPPYHGCVCVCVRARARASVRAHTSKTIDILRKPLQREVV